MARTNRGDNINIEQKNVFGVNSIGKNLSILTNPRAQGFFTGVLITVVADIIVRILF